MTIVNSLKVSFSFLVNIKKLGAKSKCPLKLENFEFSPTNFDKEFLATAQLTDFEDHDKVFVHSS